MERVKIEALPRIKESKGSKKKLREKGYVPAVIYGRKADAVSVFLSGQSLRKVLAASAGSNVILDLQIKGGNGSSVETVMIKDLHRHPVQKDLLLHVDFLRISLDEKLEVSVPLNFIGEPEGIKDGGVFQIQLREIAVKCLPSDIPNFIDVPVEEMKVGDVLTVASLNLPEGVELVEEADMIIASVITSQVEEVPAEAEDAGEAAEQPEKEGEE
ncbi:MAG: 50S ribosomal protein L25 [Firmicutes bacterium]|nr:50S ribosomal protein L25 [Bacillota bacterium]